LSADYSVIYLYSSYTVLLLLIYPPATHGLYTSCCPRLMSILLSTPYCSRLTSVGIAGERLSRSQAY
jgi:hypothetical protein